MSTTLDRVQGAFLGVMIGDALGMAVETMSREQILAAETRGKRAGQPVSSFIDPVSGREWVGPLVAGQMTDDSDLTVDVIECYIANRGLNPIDLAQRHIRRLDSTVGMGGTLRRGLEQIRDYYESDGIKGRSPFDWPLPMGPKMGAGNGVAMQISPVGLWSAIKGNCWFSVLGDTISVARLTHPDHDAMISSYVLAMVIKRVAEKSISSVAESKLLLQEIVDQNLFTEKIDRIKPNLRYQLSRVLRYLGYPELIFRNIGPGFSAVTSVPYAIGQALSSPGDFMGTLLRIVNDGGDADSTASMAGAIIGANLGLTAIPEEMRNFNPDFARAFVLAEQFYSAATTA